MSLIITIGRQFGSGGRDVGEKVAKHFGIPFYDKELVEMAAQKSNLSHEALREVDEHATNSFLYSLASGNYSLRGINAPIYYEMPINDKLFIAQAEVIKEIAKQGSCVIVGRCADYVLEEEKDVELLNVFIHGGIDYRAKRVMEALGLSQAKARDKVIKTDKQRRTYYDYYTSRDWGVMSNYDMCVNAEKFGIDGTADLVISCAQTLMDKE
ncbi:MAG: cytidylate kinase-like family protein [Clostridia bacterium]|nr:cytidylate kinase-like family protein [Clostridia bacterium]MBQ3461678.1 cytidylate kinase-like family protein [Clostridia bacterium]MBQ3472348.1 cytidylate kinase-like family protein [Clostridia bacterium]MBQ6530417.1 cytidylate kinase-like family protein [Clostridia bacterium]MBQ6558798.1 cytidylate kinase-like family protein [Clostridia bacterium]